MAKSDIITVLEEMLVNAQRQPHCTKDTHESPVSRTRRIWCEDCRVVMMQFLKIEVSKNLERPDKAIPQIFFKYNVGTRQHAKKEKG
jgi:hypothetical protein